MTLNDITIPVGWSALYDPATKTASGYLEFPKGGKAKTALSVLSAATEADLKTLAVAQGITLPAAATIPGKPFIPATPLPTPTK